PRAAAFEQRFDGVVSYDALFDAHATVQRRVPAIATMLRNAGFGKLVDQLVAIRARFDPSVAWGLAQGQWALGTAKPIEVVDAFKPYSLKDVAWRIRQDVLVFAGSEDQFIASDQVEQYRNAVVNARSVTVKLYDPPSGGAEHSQLGASTLWQADFF